jgi:hypothetical protein
MLSLSFSSLSLLNSKARTAQIKTSTPFTPSVPSLSQGFLASVRGQSIPTMMAALPQSKPATSLTWLWNCNQEAFDTLSDPINLRAEDGTTASGRILNPWHVKTESPSFRPKLRWVLCRRCNPSRRCRFNKDRPCLLASLTSFHSKALNHPL